MPATRPLRAVLICAALLLTATPAGAQPDHRALLAKIDTDLFGLPAPEALEKPLQLWATWYHVHTADSTPDGFPLPGLGGQPISPPVPGRDWCQGALQGVIAIRAPDGIRRTYTYERTGPTAEVSCPAYFQHPASWTRAAGRSRFAVSRGPFGDGAGGFQVVPFRTLAVDTKLIPLGTALFIPAARGVEITLPSGRKARHDGYFFASDRGGGITDNHVDVFVGLWAMNPFPSFVSSTPTRTFEAYVVIDERVKPHLHNLHALD